MKWLLILFLMVSSVEASIFTVPSEDEAVKIKRAMVEMNAKLLQGEKARCKASFDYLWARDFETTQAILDEFGTEAKDLFIAHGAWQDYIEKIDPTYERLVPPHIVTINEDGSVTLTEVVIEEPVEEPIIEEPVVEPTEQ